MSSIRNRSEFHRFWFIAEKIQCHLIVFLVTPAYFMFMMIIIRRHVVAEYKMHLAKHIMHVILSTYCFVNITGNMMLSILTDTSLKNLNIPIKVNCGFCEHCNKYRPEYAWHCKTCNVCILKRDHHCYIFNRCVGLKNRRYFIMYLAHMFVGMIYSTYYSLVFVNSKFHQDGIVLSVFRLVNPFIRYMVPEPWGIRDLYVIFIFLNSGLIIWSGGMLYFHLNNMLMGVTARESCSLNLSVLRYKWKENVLSVFGVKWYLVIFWPFVESSLVINGTILD